MSLSLTPPPRKPSLGAGGKSLAGGASSLHSPPLSPPVSRRHPRVNTNIAASSIQENNPNADDEDRAFDLALAKLLGQTSLDQDDAMSSTSTSTSNPHASIHDLERPARPHSIASASSLGSSYSGSHTTPLRRISHATMAHSTSSTGSGSGVGMRGSGGEATEDYCVHCGTTVSFNSQLPSPTTTDQDGPSSLQQVTASLGSSVPSYTASSSSHTASVRSNSVCSAGLFDEGASIASWEDGSKERVLACPHHHHGNRQQPSSKVLDIHSTYPYNHRNSLHLFEDQGEMTTPLEVLQSLVPSQVRCRLSYHLDECWLVQFSPSGEYLASSGADHCVMLWGDLTTPKPKILKTFTMNRPATAMIWSPNSKYLAINLGRNALDPGNYAKHSVVIMDVETSEPVAEVVHPSECKSACGVGWSPDSDLLLTVSVEGLFCAWNLKGEITRTYQYNKAQIANMYVTPSQDAAIFSTVQNEVVILDLAPNVADEHRARTLDNLSSAVVSFAFRKDGIVALSVKVDRDLPRPAHILLYNWQSMTYLRTLEADTYENNEFIIVPTFLGPEEELLVSGSENGRVHVWDVASGELIQTLEEHSKHVGGVARNHAEPGMMATCSDDNHILIWVTKELNRKLELSDQEWLKNQSVALPAINLKKGW